MAFSPRRSDCFRGIASSRYCELQTLISPGRQCWKSNPRRLDNRVEIVAQCRGCDWPQCSWPSREGRQKFIGCHWSQGNDPTHHAVLVQPDAQGKVAPPPIRTAAIINDIADLDTPGPKVGKRRLCKFGLDGTEVTSFCSEHAPSDTACIAARAFLASKLSATVIRSAFSTHTLIYHRSNRGRLGGKGLLQTGLRDPIYG